MRWILFFICLIVPATLWATEYTLTPPEPYVTGEAIGHQNLKPPPGVMPTAQYKQGIYIDANLGYALLDWKAANSGLTNVDDAGGGLVYGADFGYHRWFYGAELGGLIFPAQRFLLNGTQIQARQYMTYLAARFFIPIYHSLQMIMKLGVSYVFVNTRISAEKTKNYWEPMVSAGFMYYLTPSWSIQSQFIFLNGGGQLNLFDTLQGSRISVPNSYIFLIGMGYEFHF